MPDKTVEVSMNDRAREVIRMNKRRQEQANLERGYAVNAADALRAAQGRVAKGDVIPDIPEAKPPVETPLEGPTPENIALKEEQLRLHEQEQADRIADEEARQAEAERIQRDLEDKDRKYQRGRSLPGGSSTAGRRNSNRRGLGQPRAIRVARRQESPRPWL